MLFIYSINNKTYEVKLHDMCASEEKLSGLLETVAKNFITREEGERRAEAPFKDEIPDEQIVEDGYFLRHSSTKPNQIDVYLRKTNVNQGRVWNSYEVTCEKVLHFSVTEAGLELPIEKSNKGVLSPKFSNSLEAEQQSAHIAELKARLVSRRQKVDTDLLVAEPMTLSLPIRSSSETSFGNPAVLLRKRIEQDFSE